MPGPHGPFSCARSRALIRALAIAVAVVVAGAGLRSVLAVAPATAASSPNPTLAWRSCGGGFRCATLRVPLDEARPDGKQLGIAVIRRPARDAADRIGTLVVNPGGPGVSGVDFLRAQADSFPAAMQDAFDLVAFDPRGVGGSGPVDCVDSLDPLFAQQFSPTSPERRDALVDAYRDVAAGCAARSGGLLAHVSTLETAHDLDRLRAALGEDHLDYLGYSYGTYLGALYAREFPDRVGRIVLDGPVDPSLDGAAGTLSQARGFERGLDAFFTWCAGDESCMFREYGAPAAAYDALRARLVADPVPAEDQPGRSLGQTRFDAAVLQLLYGGRSQWRPLDRGLTATEDGNSSPLLELADAYEGRDDSGRDDGALESFWAIACRDGPAIGDVAAAAALEAEVARVAPRLGPFIVNNSLACSVWPQPALPPTGPIAAAGTPPILVVGTTRDPATPYSQARALARQLEAGVLLTVAGRGHTSFGTGNECADRVVVRFLRTGEPPPAGTRC
jgi:pimeloyl-ACP methyl ester carboxylesterase